MSESKNSEWKELCAAAAHEPDARKLASLVNQIIEAFDRAIPPRRTSGSRMASAE
jgi:hypothetical protein